jgi:hypothetical protein
MVLMHADAVTRKGHDSFENKRAIVWAFHQHKVCMGGTSPVPEHTV